jgi:predicted aspartyl protease
MDVRNLTIALSCIACAGAPKTPHDEPSCAGVGPEFAQDPASTSVPFTRFAGHILVVTARIAGGPEEKFVLDTGAGINVISTAVCARIHCALSGEHEGQRMSGQTLKVPMTTVPSLAFGSYARKDVAAGVLDLEALGLGTDFAGFLSLAFFENVPFTIDYKQSRVLVESAATLPTRRTSGRSVKVRVAKKGAEVGVFLPVVLPNGAGAELEVDTGSDSLILHEKFMKPLGFDPGGANVKRREGQDETKHTYVRYFSVLEAPIRLGMSDASASNLPIMFQTIIYDGLVGDAFLKRFTVTYDLPHTEMIFGP